MQRIQIAVLVALGLVGVGSLQAEDSTAKAKQVLIRARVLECRDDPRGGTEKTKAISGPIMSTLEQRPAFFEFGYDVPVADGERGVRFVPVGKKVEVNVKFVEEDRIQLAVVALGYQAGEQAGRGAAVGDGCSQRNDRSRPE